jgi:hypothetical protein
MNRFVKATFLQFVGTVGSGIFVLPFLFAQSNFIFASLFLIFFVVVTATFDHFYVEIINATSGDHQLTGYAEIYLGKKYKFITTLNLILLAFGAIVAYYKLFSNFSILIFPHISLFSISSIFLIVSFLMFYFRQQLSQNIFVFIPIFMLVVPILLFIFSITDYGIPISSNIYPNFSFIGATIFALSGFTIIPEVRESLGSNKKFSLAVLAGLLLAAFIYFLYTFSIIRLSGPLLSVDSLSGLAKIYPGVTKILAVFGMIITLRAASNFLIVLRELFYRDLNIPKSVSNFLPILFPFLALSLGTVSLITIISLTGHFTIFVSAIIICCIRLKLPRTFWTEFGVILVILSLSVGLVINLFY